MADTDFDSEIHCGKNKKCVRCKFCSSLILPADLADFVKHDEAIKLPHMHLKNSQDPSTVETDDVTDFWVVGDMFQFDNIGFSHTIDNRKYLVCADCEMGPVGYHDIGTRKECYVALSRVKHQNEK